MKREKKKPETMPSLKLRQVKPETSNQQPATKTLQYKQNNIHDFAWFADKRFIVNYDTCRLVSGKIIEVYTYFIAAESDYWKKSIQFSKDAVRFYSQQVGEYAYNVVSAVQGPKSFGGGMEYPTITVISPIRSETELDRTIAHEIGHNWFYGILASNERVNPWMDEGINTFYEQKYAESKNGSINPQERILFETTVIEKKDQPIETSSEQYNILNYELDVYYKTSEWMRLLESKLGEEKFIQRMHAYYNHWQFKHPQPEDFKNEISEYRGDLLDSVFTLLHQKGILPNMQREGWKTVSILRPGRFKSYLNDPSKNLFIFGPAIGFNSYDKFMIGGIFTNYALPPSALQFLLIPMYATGSKTFEGLGKLNYSFYPGNRIRKVDLFLNGSLFTQDRFTDSSGKKTFFGFKKVVPGLRLTFRQNNYRSTIIKYIQWKSFLLREEGLKFSTDTIINGTDTTISDIYGKTNENSTLNQLQFVIQNFRELYPYSAEIKIEQGKDFIRSGFTGNYFFNYPKEGGLNLRLFAGKFFYTVPKTINKEFNTDRYHLNMTGPNGFEDFTYSDYFIGRNKFEGLGSQQIMMRDGGFKVRTNLLADKVGKSDDWLIAANFNSSIPSKINPLSVLPIKIPLKIFLDVGTYAEAWKSNSDLDHFVFDAGLQIPLFKETINIYVPLIYSKVYKDYIQSTLAKKNRLLKTISFSIDISLFDLKKINRLIGYL